MNNATALICVNDNGWGYRGRETRWNYVDPKDYVWWMMRRDGTIDSYRDRQPNALFGFDIWYTSCVAGLEEGYPGSYEYAE